MLRDQSDSSRREECLEIRVILGDKSDSFMFGEELGSKSDT